MSPIRDAVEDMAVDMELSDEEQDREPKDKRGALYMLGSVASAAAAAFDTRPLHELHYARDSRGPLRNRLGFLKGGKEDVVVDMAQSKEYDDKVVGRVWEHVENTRVYRS